MLFRHGDRIQQLSIMKCVKIFPGNLQLEVIKKLLIMIPMTHIISTIPIIINSITTIDTRSYLIFVIFFTQSNFLENEIYMKFISGMH